MINNSCQCLLNRASWREATSRHTVDQWLKARVGAKKSDGTALTVTTQENAIKKTFG